MEKLDSKEEKKVDKILKFSINDSLIKNNL